MAVFSLNRFRTTNRFFSSRPAKIFPSPRHNSLMNQWLRLDLGRGKSGKKSRAEKWSTGIRRQLTIFLPWIFLPSLSFRHGNGQKD
jgi:hypothetical protein